MRLHVDGMMYQMLPLVLQTVVNLANGACHVVLPLVFITALTTVVLSMWTCWQSVDNSYEALTNLQMPPEP